MSKCRIYGNENTHLTLTDKAFAAYSVIDPLDIIEFEDEMGGLSYSFRGAIDADLLTEEGVNEWLEELIDCTDEECDRYEPDGTYYVWCNNGECGFIIVDGLDKESAEQLCEKWSKAEPTIQYIVCNHDEEE